MINTSGSDAISFSFFLLGRAGPAETFPGVQPTTLEQGYLVQEVAIHLWPDDIAGWKIGLVAPPLRERLGSDRVAGPIFSRAVRKAGGVVDFPVFEGGFAAVEAEYVFRMGRDAPAGKTAWTDGATSLSAAMRWPTSSFMDNACPPAVTGAFDEDTAPR